LNADNELLFLKDISKSFYGVNALKSVNFQLFKGEVHALVGENGAGKSTLIKVVAGVHKPDSGVIIYEGESIRIHNPRDAFSLGIGTIHQEFNLVPYLDSACNIFLGREFYNKLGKINQKLIYDKTEELFEKIGANINPRTPVKDLGVAEKQMVEICKALSLNVKILIMDEPTAVLSGKEIDKLFEIIASLRKQRISVIYISHRLEELFRIADRATVLRDGCLIGTVNVKDVNKDIITKMMIGRDLTEQYPRINKTIREEILRVCNLSRKGILHDISFTVKKGEILGLAGLVGSGRTEVARAIVGLDQFDSGSILLEGNEIKISSPNDAINKGIALVPEERKTQGLVLSLSMEKNITLPYMNFLSNLGIISKKKVYSTSEKLISELNIKPNNLNYIVRSLSGGNQQKVVIAKWMVQNYKIMIFDEPTRGVDVGAKVEIYKLINMVASQGVSVIMISSDLPEILGMSDRILVMKEGRIAGEIAHDNVTEEDVMKYAF